MSLASGKCDRTPVRDGWWEEYDRATVRVQRMDDRQPLWLYETTGQPRGPRRPRAPSGIYGYRYPGILALTGQSGGRQRLAMDAGATSAWHRITGFLRSKDLAVDIIAAEIRSTLHERLLKAADRANDPDAKKVLIELARTVIRPPKSSG